MENFFIGTGYFLLGMRTIFTKGLKRYVILPITFNFLLFAGLFYVIYHYLAPYPSVNTSYSIFKWVLFITLAISFFLLFLSMFTVIFNLIAAPFNGLLAEKAQACLYNSSIPSLTFLQIAKRSIKRQGEFIAFFLPRFIGICILFFVPFIHPIYPFLWFLFNAWMLSIQYQDYAQDNNLVNFKEMRATINEHRMVSIGFGTIINIASFIPVINILIMPAAVIGGVAMYCEQQKPQLKRLPRSLLKKK